MHIKDFDPYDFSMKEIEGVPVYYKKLPWAPCIHMRFCFSTGAFADPVGKEGVAHFLEHLIGDGNPILPTRKDQKEFNKKYMLNSRNAMTGHYYTQYFGKCLPEHFEKVFETMKVGCFEPFLRPEDVEQERSIITQEAWGRYKNAKMLAYAKETSQNEYPGHIRSRIASPLGWPETIRDITREDIADFHKKYYVKENLFVFIVGAIEDEDIAFVAEALKGLPSGEKFREDYGTIGKRLVPRLERAGEDIGHVSEQATFVLSRATSEIDPDEDEAGSQARDLLYDALFERLRTEHSLCYGVSVGWSRVKDYLEAGISVNTSEEKIPLVEKEVWNVIREILDGKWEKRFKELHSLNLDLMRSRERMTDQIIHESAQDIISNGRVINLSEMQKNAEAVTYSSVCALIKRIFDPEFVVTEIITPKK